MAAGISSPAMVTASRSFQSFPRSQDTFISSSTPTIRMPASSRLSPADSYNQHSPNSSSQTTSSGSSSPNTSANSNRSKQQYQRPSTLHGLKHKLHSSACSKTLPSCSANVSSRRKSVGHIPLSPLARTPSPSPLPASPTRSPSPLAFPVGHQPGSSNTTQSYSPSAGNAPGGGGQTKKGFVRPKAAEPGSPLLRRALSPDRLHPRSAESKCTLISPLCSSGSPTVVKNTNRGGSSAVWRPNAQTDRDEPSEPVNAQLENSGSSVVVGGSTAENRLSLNLGGPSELLPRIAEEKDSPTNNTQECSKSSK